MNALHLRGAQRILFKTETIGMSWFFLIFFNAGRDILAALENGVCQYPKLEGRFLQVSGVSFAFDPTKASGQRVDSRDVRIGDQYIEMDTKYRLVTKSYMLAGKDGFDCFNGVKVLVSIIS